VHVDATSGEGGWTRSLGRQYLFFPVGFLGDAVVITGWQEPVWVVPEDGPITQVPHLRGHNVLLEARTGRVVASLPRRLYPITWEDERHLLAVAHGDHSQAMVRVDLTGRAELVGPVVEESAYRYVFETQP
jgi:hypothetical protein